MQLKAKGLKHKANTEYSFALIAVVATDYTTSRSLIASADNKEPETRNLELETFIASLEMKQLKTKNSKLRTNSDMHRSC